MYSASATQKLSIGAVSGTALENFQALSEAALKTYRLRQAVSKLDMVGDLALSTYICRRASEGALVLVHLFRTAVQIEERSPESSISVDRCCC